MKIVFAGTPDFAAVCLRRMAAAAVEIAAVVTQPDRPRGRGRRVEFCETKLAAAELGLDVIQPEDINDPAAVEALRAFNADALVVVAYGGILRRAARESARLGAINVHASLLPRYRGAAPIPRAIMDRAAKTGVTIQRLEARLDAGAILAAAETEIGAEETAGELFGRLADLGADLLASGVPDLERYLERAVPQDESQATCAPPLSPSEARVDWQEPAGRVCGRILALNPWPKAYCYVGEESEANRLLLLRAREARPNVPGGRAVRSGPCDRGGIPGPGTVLEAGDQGLVVAAGEGSVCVTELQAPGRRPMPAAEFLRGRRIKPGEVLVRK